MVVYSPDYATRSCWKCGGTGFSCRHTPGAVQHGTGLAGAYRYAGDEALTWTCQHCGFTFESRCKDYVR